MSHHDSNPENQEHHHEPNDYQPEKQPQPDTPPPIYQPPKPAAPANGPAPVWHPPVKKPLAPIVKQIRKTCAWICIATVVIAVIFSLASIWGSFDSDVAGKAWATFAIVGFGSLVVGVIAQLLDN
ncbi:hypothetical protein FWF48_02880 [Candidatus Saccharibacteria bacterium]|nr:hypothetical protein [Candidatus Saccharibacteria bacterium]